LATGTNIDAQGKPEASEKIMNDKVILSNRSALQAKYGSKGLAAVRKALTALLAADKKRGIKSSVVYLDNAAAMKKLGGQAVQNATDPRENKAAIDAVYEALNPDYLLILGAPDVVPHQDLNNTAFSAGDDDDAFAFGDVPYACDAPYSRDPAHFIGPTRVVGRLPDLTGATEPSYLLGLLKTAANYKQRPPQDYAAYFGLSAAVWQGSTRMSLRNIFGAAHGPGAPQRSVRHAHAFHQLPRWPSIAGVSGPTR
jgi:hypothetical protein